MQADKFLKELDKKVPSLVVITGDEYYYVNLVVKKIKEKWFVNESNCDINILPTEPALGNFSDLIYGNSFFSSRSLIIIEQSQLLSSGSKLSEKQEAEYLKLYSNMPSHCCVVIKCEKPDKRTKKYKAISAVAALVECEKVKPYKLKVHLEAMAKDYERRFEPTALALLMEYFSLLEEVSLYFIQQEIEKIYLYAGERQVWSKADVEAVFSNITGISGFSLTKAMLSGNAAKALHILHEQLTQGEQLLSVTGRVAWQVRNLWLAKSILQNGGQREDVLAQTDTTTFFVNDLINDCKSIPEERLKQAMLELANINREMRLGGRGVVHLEEVIVNFCQPK